MFLYTFKHLSTLKSVTHGIAPRQSKGKSLNVAFEFGDDALTSRRIIAETLGLSGVVSAHQTHSDHVAIFKKNDLVPSDEINDVDAFISDRHNVGFMVKTADCQPILMVGIGEKKQPVIAVVHSGWRGSLKNIAGKTVRKMMTEFGVNPPTILAGIGPSLGPCCAEFSDPENELTSEALAYRVDVSNRFDFWAMTRDQLHHEGVPIEAMEFSGICTVCEKNNWFSFRGDSPDEGRFGSVIGLV